MQPSELTIPQGIYLIQVTNAVVLAPVTVQLTDERAARLAEVRSKPGAPRSNIRVALGPGKHTLSIRGRPQWSCNITVVRR